MKKMKMNSYYNILKKYLKKIQDKVIIKFKMMKNYSKEHKFSKIKLNKNIL